MSAPGQANLARDHEKGVIENEGEKKITNHECITLNKTSTRPTIFHISGFKPLLSASPQRSNVHICQTTSFQAPPPSAFPHMSAPTPRTSSPHFPARPSRASPRQISEPSQKRQNHPPIQSLIVNRDSIQSLGNLANPDPIIQQSLDPQNPTSSVAKKSNHDYGNKRQSNVEGSPSMRTTFQRNRFRMNSLSRPISSTRLPASQQMPAPTPHRLQSQAPWPAPHRILTPMPVPASHRASGLTNGSKIKNGTNCFAFFCQTEDLNYRKFMTIQKLCKRSFKCDVAGHSSFFRLEMA